MPPALLSLPPELHLAISDHFSHDESKNLSSIARTCKNFYNIFNPILYSNELRINGGTNAFLHAVVRNTPSLVELFIKRFNLSPDILLKYTIVNQPINRHLRYYRTYTALHIACCLGHIKVVKTLLSLGANINSRNYMKQTPLQMACLEGNFEVARLLISKGADPNAMDDQHLSAVHDTSHGGFFLTMRLLLRAGGDPNTNGRDPQNDVDMGYSPLHAACDFGQTSVARMLVDAGADIEAKIHHSGWTPLVCAAAEGHHTTVAMLLRYGASVHTWPEYPLRVAADGKYNEKLLGLLFEHGADPSRVWKEDGVQLIGAEKGRRMVEFHKIWLKKRAQKEEEEKEKEKKAREEELDLGIMQLVLDTPDEIFYSLQPTRTPSLGQPLIAKENASCELHKESSIFQSTTSNTLSLTQPPVHKSKVVKELPRRIQGPPTHDSQNGTVRSSSERERKERQ